MAEATILSYPQQQLSSDDFNINNNNNSTSRNGINRRSSLLQKMLSVPSSLSYNNTNNNFNNNNNNTDNNNNNTDNNNNNSSSKNDDNINGSSASNCISSLSGEEGLVLKPQQQQPVQQLLLQEQLVQQIQMEQQQIQQEQVQEQEKPLQHTKSQTIQIQQIQQQQETQLQRTPSQSLQIPAQQQIPQSQQQQGRARMIGNYCVERTIGRGQFGKVKLAYHKRVPDLKVAIKIINKSKLDEDTLRMIQREVRIIKLMNHPHIVKLYEVIETTRTFFLIMEYAEGGEVMDFIIAHGKIQEREARRFFVQMLSAIQYCHSKRCCHRDIKPENLLLDSNMNIKIIECTSLIKRMLVVDPAARATIDEIRSHTWLSAIPQYLTAYDALDVDDSSKINAEIITEMETFGFNPEEVTQSILSNSYNDAAATYFLLDSARQRRSQVAAKEEAKGPLLTDSQVISITESNNSTFRNSGPVNNMLPSPPKSPQLPLSKNGKRGHRRIHTVDAYTSSENEKSLTPTSPASSTSDSSSPVESPNLANKKPPLPHTYSGINNNHTDKDTILEKEKLLKGFNVKTLIKGSSRSRHRRAASEVTSDEIIRRHSPDTGEFLGKRASQVVSTRPHTDPKHHDDRKIKLKDDDISIENGGGSNSSAPKPGDYDDECTGDGDDESRASRSPTKSAVSSLFSSFKSMWTKHRKGDNNPQPRVVRFAFSVSTTSDRQADEILKEVQRVLREYHIPFTMKSPFYADCVVDNVRFSVEVCRLPRLLVSGIRLSRISGSAWKYKTIVKDLVGQMKI